MADKKKIVYKIDGKWINDPSALHSMIPNFLDFTVTLGDPLSKLSTSVTVGMPTDVVMKSTSKALTFKGELPGGEKDIPTLTPEALVGDIYKVSLDGYINNTKVEEGDMLICIANSSAADSETYKSIDANWNYVQKNIDSTSLSKAGHVHDVSYSGETELGGDVIPTGVVSAPDIDANVSMGTLSYIEDGSCIVNTSTMKVDDVVKGWNYDAEDENIDVSMSSLMFDYVTGVDFVPQMQTSSVVVDVAPELSSAPIFTGSVLPTHKHQIVLNFETEADKNVPKPNLIYYNTSDGNKCDVLQLMQSYADANDSQIMNNVVSNEWDGEKWVLTCEYPIISTGADWSAEATNAANDSSIGCNGVYPLFVDVSNNQPTNLTMAILPTCTLAIGVDTFANCQYLQDITLSKNIDKIKEFAFGNCSNFNLITYTGYKANWFDIDKDTNAFYGCPNDLKVLCKDTIIMAVYAITYTTTDGSIYDMQEIFDELHEEFPDAEIPTITSNQYDYCLEKFKITFDRDFDALGYIFDVETETVTKVYPMFASVSNIDTVDIPSYVTALYAASFVENEINVLHIPASIKTLNSMAVAYCPNLSNGTITYEGTKQQWREISKTEIWYNDIPATDVLCSDGYISLDAVVGPKENEIWYTTSDNLPIDIDGGYDLLLEMFELMKQEGLQVLYKTDVNHIVSQKYDTNKNVVIATFEQPVTTAGVIFELFESGGMLMYEIGPMLMQSNTLTSVIYPDGMKKIGMMFVNGCENIQSIKMPETLEYVEQDALSNLGDEVIENLITEKDNIQYVGRVAVGLTNTTQTSYTVKKGTRVLGKNLFYNLSNVTTINLPEGLKQLQENSINSCSNLVNVNIPNSLSYANYSLFNNCNNITTNVSNYITYIGNNATYAYEVDDYTQTSYTFAENTKIISEIDLYECDNIETLTIPENIEYIESEVISELNISSINIPAKVKSIGMYNGVACPNLSIITVDPSNAIYDSRNNCNAVIDSRLDVLVFGCKNTIIPNDVVALKEYALCECIQDYVETFNIPNSVKYIFTAAFIGNNVSNIVIGSGIEFIGEYAFAECDNLESITLLATNPPIISEDTFEEIPDNCVFYVLPDVIDDYKSAEIWSDYADRIEIMPMIVASNEIYYKTSNDSIFDASTATRNAISAFTDLTGINVPDGSINHIISNEMSPYGYYKITCERPINAIGVDASLIGTTMNLREVGPVFAISQAESSLTEVYLPSNVAVIGGGSFTNNSELTTLELPLNLILIGSDFGENYGAFENTGMQDFEIPNNVTYIGKYAFANCENITEAIIPASVKAIADNAYYNCDNIDNIMLSNGLLSIGNNAFKNCTDVRIIDIPTSVTSIGNNAFDINGSIKYVKSMASSPATIGNNVFGNPATANFAIYVKPESVDTYKSANGWKDYISNILVLPEKPLDNLIFYMTNDGLPIDPEAFIKKYGSEFSESGEVPETKNRLLSNVLEEDHYVLTYQEDLTLVGIDMNPAEWSINNIGPMMVKFPISDDDTQMITSVLLPDTIEYIGMYGVGNESEEMLDSFEFTFPANFKGYAFCGDGGNIMLNATNITVYYNGTCDDWVNHTNHNYYYGFCGADWEPYMGDIICTDGIIPITDKSEDICYSKNGDTLLYVPLDTSVLNIAEGTKDIYIYLRCLTQWKNYFLKI